MFRNTVNGERFARLNIHSFSLMKFFTEILLRCPWPAVFINLTIVTYSWKNFRGTLKNHESLAHQILPRLQYMEVILYLKVLEKQVLSYMLINFYVNS